MLPDGKHRKYDNPMAGVRELIVKRNELKTELERVHGLFDEVGELIVYNTPFGPMVKVTQLHEILRKVDTA